MGGLVVAMISFTGIMALLLAVLVAVTVVPVYAAVQMAEVRRFSTTRWCAIASVAVVLGLGLAYELHKHDVTRLLVMLPVVLTWAAPAALWLLEAGQTRIGGRAGAHE